MDVSREQLFNGISVNKSNLITFANPGPEGGRLKVHETKVAQNSASSPAPLARKFVQ